MTVFRVTAGAVVCVRQAKPRRRRCTVCGHVCDPYWLRECDFVLPAGKTCDLLMCTRCATPIADNKDLCPAHALTRADTPGYVHAV